MSVRIRLALFAAALGVVCAAAVAVGSALEPADIGGDAGHEESAHEADHDTVGHGGRRLSLRQDLFAAGEPAELSFSVLDPDDYPVTEFDELHERRMHLIVVRRDGTGFRHLHPEMDDAGTWSTPVRFAEAGAYRVFADFAVEGEDATLSGDVYVDGAGSRSRPFPAPTPVYETDGYVVRVAGTDVTAGEEATLRFTVSRDGRPVTEVADYLGAKGHLVVLREGDLAFLHAHPEEHGEGIEFATVFPTPGRYRLYLQFKHAGVVRTAEFTVEVPR